MAKAGYQSIIKATGTATSMTDEACTENSGTEFQITDSSKRILNPSASFTVKVDGSAVSSSTYSLDYYFGKITFNTSQTGSTVTITGEYKPSYKWADATAMSFTVTRNVNEYAVFEEDVVKREQALFDANASVTRVQLSHVALDGTNGPKPNNLLDGGTDFVFEVQPEGATGTVHRSWMKVQEQGVSSAPEDLVNVNLTLVANQQEAADGTLIPVSSYS